MKKQVSNRNRTSMIRKLTVTAIMSALSYALMLIQFPLPFMPFFIEFDISELPALITSFAFGPQYGIVVCLLKNAIHCFISETFTVGELSNFILGSVFVGIAGLIYMVKKSRKYAIIGSLVGSFAMAVVCFFSNMYITYPFYAEVFTGGMDAILGLYQAILPSMDSIWKSILVFNVPFTFAKGLVSVVITFLVYRKLSPILKGKLEHKS